ncbi:MAG: hypothetical protein ABJB74_12845 [Gemmatimonas sp.]
MSDDRLRAIYNARVASTAPGNRADCPSPDELQRLAQSGAGGSTTNLKLLDHVFGCAYCRAEFALLCAVQTATETGEGVLPARAKASARWFTGPRLAIAAALLVAIGIGGAALRRSSSNDSSSAVRGSTEDASDVVIVAPAKNAKFTLDAQFVWRRVAGAVTYEIQLLDTAGVVLGTHVTADTTFVPGADERATLSAAKQFDWFVVARRADGNERRSAVLRATVSVTERR